MTVISGIILQVKSYFAFVYSSYVVPLYHSNEPSCMQNKMQLIEIKFLKGSLKEKTGKFLKILLEE